MVWEFIKVITWGFIFHKILKRIRGTKEREEEEHEKRRGYEGASIWTLSCSKCHHNFTTRAIEGTEVKCFECGNLIYIPVQGGLHKFDLSAILDMDIKDWERVCECPGCKQSFITHKKNIGLEGKCPECHEYFKINPLEVEKKPKDKEN